MDATARAVEENLSQYLQHFGRARGGRCVQARAWRWIHTGSPLLNRVFDARIDGDPDVAVKAALAPFRERGHPVTWMVGPSSHPATLAPVLEANGFRRVHPWVGMVRALAPADAAQAGLHAFVPVDSADRLAAWAEVAGPAFGIPSSLHGSFVRLFSGLLVGERVPFHGLLALDGRGQALGTGLSYLAGETAGLYWIATSPERRGQGIGTALTRRLMGKARACGAKRVVLHATEAGLGLYRRLGFEEVCRIELFSWEPNH